MFHKFKKESFSAQNAELLHEVGENRVSPIHETTNPEQESYYVGSIAEHKPQPRMAVMKLQVSAPTFEKEVQLQIDTGSHCDILPAWIYKQVTGNTLLRNLKP